MLVFEAIFINGKDTEYSYIFSNRRKKAMSPRLFCKNRAKNKIYVNKSRLSLIDIQKLQ